MLRENSRGYGEHGGQYMRCVRIGYALEARNSLTSGERYNFADADGCFKGYELADEEVKISLEEFRAQYGDPNGGPE